MDSEISFPTSLSNRTIIIGSRGSDLALWQANFLLKKIRDAGYPAEIKVIKTKGDQIQDLGFNKMEGKGFFTKELEEALLGKEIDIAVHSFKDLPTESPSGLLVAAVSSREDPSDWLIMRKESHSHMHDMELLPDSTIGTSSARRKVQIMSLRKDCRVLDLRGNVPTRLEKLRRKEYDAIILAAAGVLRLKLKLKEFQIYKLNPRFFVPAPAQGVLAYQIRDDEYELTNLLKQLGDKTSFEISMMERSLMHLFEGGCQLPLGVYVEKKSSNYHLWAMHAEKDGSFPRRIFYAGDKGLLANTAYENLQSQSAKKIFISREINDSSLFKRYLTDLGYEIEGRSLIDYRLNNLADLQEADWLFFSSKHCVRFFLELFPHRILNFRIACIGKGTAEELKKHGATPEFVGLGGNTKAIGKQFLEVSRGLKVLFPIGSDSIRSVQKEIEKQAEVIDLEVYHSSLIELFKESDAELLLFTSPMNAQTYLSHYVPESQQKLIAIGNTTAAVFKDFDISNYTICWGPNEMAMADAVMSS